MIIDSKYHVASLVAVFLALGMGIVIGSLMVGEGLVKNIVNEQENLVNRLETDYENLKKEAKLSRDEINSLKKTAEYYKQYARETLSFVVRGSLEGRKIAVFDSGEGQKLDFFLESLKLSGAQVFYPEESGLEQLKQLSRLKEKVDTVIIVNDPFQETQAALATNLAKMGIGLFFIETNASIMDINVETRQKALFYIDSIDSVPEEVALIKAIAGFN